MTEPVRDKQPNDKGQSTGPKVPEHNLFNQVVDWRKKFLENVVAGSKRESSQE